MLAAHPYRTELCGSPNDLAWPAIWANCGNPASEQIPVRKAFSSSVSSSRRSRSHTYSYWYKVYSAPVPFCAACARVHRATARPPTLAGAVAAVLFHPNIVAVIGCAWLLRWPLSAVSWTSFNVPQLRRAGYEVLYREFDGPHTVPREVAREALDWFTAGGG